MPISIPERLEERLRDDPALNSFVLASLRELGDWIRDSKVVFFPEYTDHGEAHVKGVLETACALITEESWPVLSARDAAVLAVSAAIHDCALHLSEDSFLAMMSFAESSRSRYFKDRAWPQEWAEFLMLASRYDGMKLRQLFGDAEPIRKPPTDVQQLNRRDRLLIGEFLRGRHARVAEEVACHGLLAVHGRRVQMVHGPDWMRELSGLVARSHGLPIRIALDAMERSQWRTSSDVHVPYLMTVLRIADYLQIQSDRAPVSLLAVRALRSPLSLGEWQLHKSVYDLNWTQEDPEAVYVQMRPDSANTFLKGKALLRSIQNELDESWAVLGEVYGRMPPLDGLGIRLRRIRSSLDDEAKLERELDFAPCEARFDTSRGELLKLLVRPLYGEHSEFGVRELLQNAVDACRERAAQNDASGCPGVEPAVAITIEQDGETYWLSVEDSGIGMTVDIVRSFFLKAGASFRSSDAWKRDFLDSDGRPRVLRSGRFGVGALAAFLLGDSIDVTTRHSGSERGFSFHAGLDDENIELRYCDRPPGTTIRIRLDKQVAQKILEPSSPYHYRDSTDFYCLCKPEVKRRYLGKEMGADLYVPDPGGGLPSHWRRFSSAGFDDIFWSYWQQDRRGLPVSSGLVCNGIKVEGERGRPYFRLSEDAQIELNSPLISVFDRDARLPLNLQRTDLNAVLPFKEDLADSVAVDVLAWLIRWLPTRITSSSFANLHKLLHPALSPRRLGAGRLSAPWLVRSQRGWLIFEGALLGAVGHQELLIDPNWRQKAMLLEKGEHHFSGSALVMLGLHGGMPGEWTNWARAVEISKVPGVRHGGDFENIESKELVIATSKLEEIRKRDVRRREHDVMWKSVAEKKIGEWTLLSSGTIADEKVDCAIESGILANAPLGFQRWRLGATSTSDTVSALSRQWLKVIGPEPIPFSQAERNELLERTPKELRECVRSHRRMAKSGMGLGGEATQLMLLDDDA